MLKTGAGQLLFIKTSTFSCKNNNRPATRPSVKYKRKTDQIQPLVATQLTLSAHEGRYVPAAPVRQDLTLRTADRMCPTILKPFSQPSVSCDDRPYWNAADISTLCSLDKPTKLVTACAAERCFRRTNLDGPNTIGQNTSARTHAVRSYNRFRIISGVVILLQLYTTSSLLRYVPKHEIIWKHRRQSKTIIKSKIILTIYP